MSHEQLHVEIRRERGLSEGPTLSLRYPDGCLVAQRELLTTSPDELATIKGEFDRLALAWNCFDELVADFQKILELPRDDTSPEVFYFAVREIARAALAKAKPQEVRRDA